MAQPTQEQMQARAIDIHGRNVAAGWWTDLRTGESLKGKRDPIELLVLVHSEISEAMEGDRKNLADDKLPHRSMFEVELGDGVIRVYDIIGGFDFVDYTGPELGISMHIVNAKLSGSTRPKALGLIHVAISEAIKSFERTDSVAREQSYMLTHIIRTIYAVADHFNLDLEGAIDEKLAYNMQRADHKPENRRLEGGKAY